MEIDRTNSVICYADVCPSELFHNAASTHLAFVLVNFFHIEKPYLNQVRQFKDTRGFERRLKTMDYLLDGIKKGAIRLIVQGYWTSKDIAFQNGRNFLVASSLLSRDQSIDSRITINGVETSVGQLISLGFYSIILSVFAQQVGTYVRFERKEQGIIMLDLLPGDNQGNSRRKLDLVQFIIHNSIMKSFFDDSIKENQISRLGFGYGIKNNSSKDFKNDFELVITDWIVQSLHCLFSNELIQGSERKGTGQLGKLADFLINEGNLKVIEPFKLRF